MQTKVDVSAEIEDMEKEFDDDTESIITNERYVYFFLSLMPATQRTKKENNVYIG